MKGPNPFFQGSTIAVLVVKVIKLLLECRQES